MANICITGINGLLGSATAQVLVSEGHRVLGVGTAENVVEKLSSKVEYFQVDITNKEKIAKILKDEDINTVFHFAGIKYIGVCEENPALCNEVNHLGTVTVVEAMRIASVPHIVFASTYAVYDLQKDVVVLSESSDTLPATAYGKSKLAAERVIIEAEKRGDIKSYQILRYANICGIDESDQSFVVQNIVDKIVEAGYSGHSIDIFGDDLSTVDGSLARDFVALKDVVAAHSVLVGFQKSEIFNIGTGVPTTLKQIISLVEKKVSRSIAINIMPRKEEPASVTLNSEKARQSFGWEARNSTEKTIGQLCEIASKAY
jgi:UDP-glucose 4-epimerase